MDDALGVRASLHTPQTYRMNRPALSTPTRMILGTEGFVPSLECALPIAIREGVNRYALGSHGFR